MTVDLVDQYERAQEQQALWEQSAEHMAAERIRETRLSPEYYLEELQTVSVSVVHDPQDMPGEWRPRAQIIVDHYPAGTWFAYGSVDAGEGVKVCARVDGEFREA